MDTAFSDESVAKVLLQAQELDSQLLPWKPLYLVILSPGGSIEAGLELIDNLKGMGREVHTVTVFGASMAFQTVMGLGNRYVTRTGTLMSHKAKGGFQGEFPGQIDSRYNYYLRRLQKMDQTVVDRSKGKLTLKKYQEMYENEYWCEGQDCVDAGVADEAVLVTCDSSLRGVVTKEEKVSFLGIPIAITATKAACPTITAPLDVKVNIDGKPVKRNEISNMATELKITNAQAVELSKLVDKKIEQYNPTKATEGRTN